MEQQKILILHNLEDKKYKFLKGFLFLSLILLPVNGFPLGLYNELLLELGFFSLFNFVSVNGNSFVREILLQLIYY